MYRIQEIGDKEKRSTITEGILKRLPHWFGIKEANEEYREGVKDLFFLALYDGSEAIGLLSLQVHNSYTGEIYLLALLEEHHGRGGGRLLLEEAEEYLRMRGCIYFMVKTLAPSREDPYYKKTRGFYSHMGFYPLLELDLWGPENPCLLMVKNL